MIYPDDYMNTIICGDCLDVLKDIPDNSIDLVVTSPPYDDMRDYQGFSFDFSGIATNLYRVISYGGILVWVVGDKTKQFCESLTSFRQAEYFVSLGFNLLDTMIYAKKNYPPTYPNMRRYIPAFEYMFVFAKGKPKTSNLICDRPNKYSGKVKSGDTQRQKDGSTRKVRAYTPKEFGMRSNIWFYDVGKNKDTKDKVAFSHPARFPEQLAYDHIRTWSNPGDVVLDPMCGSGTTCKMAKLLGRNFIGIDVSEEYCIIAEKRLENLNG